MKKKTKAKTVKPVVVKGMSFQEMIDQTANLPPPKPLSKKKQKEIDKIVKELQGMGGFCGFLVKK